MNGNEWLMKWKLSKLDKPFSEHFYKNADALKFFWFR